MFDKNESKDLPWIIFTLSMSFSSVALTTVIILGALGVIGV